MRFLSIYKTPERSTPPTAEEMATMGKLIEEAMREGWLLATEGCLPSALGARVRRSNGTVTVSDGPFTDSKEVVGGFALMEASSKAEAIELCRRFLSVAGDGECELRQLYEAGRDESCVSPSAPGAAKADAVTR
ncbi:MAG TPA: YciI family protein [Gemmatimonadaceae bacterium]